MAQQGNIAPGYASFDGCPINADTTVFNAARGTRVLDTNTGAQYLKISGYGDNTKFVQVGIGQAFTEDFNAYDTTDQVCFCLPSGAAFSGTGQVVNHMYTPGGNIFGLAALGTQTLTPAIVAAGLDIAGDQTNNDGNELFTHFSLANGRPFIIGLDPGFFLKIKFAIGDADGLDTLGVGFRRAAAPASAMSGYTDFASLGCTTAADPVAIKIRTNLNNAGETTTDTTQTATASGAGTVPITFAIYVSSAGVVTYKVDLANSGTLAAPTATAAFTFDNGDPVIPFFHFIQDTLIADTLIVYSWECGYQP